MFDYEKIPLHWVNRLSFLLRRELSTMFREANHPISSEEWAILLVLWKQSPQNPSALADVTIKDRTTITRLIDGMVSKNLVSRTEDPDDRRRSVVAITAQGLAIKDDLVPIARMLIDQALVNIPPEDIQTTIRTLRAMTENLVTPPQCLNEERTPENDRL